MAKFNKNYFLIIREFLNNNFENYIREWFPNVNENSSTDWTTGDFNDTPSQDGSLHFNLKEKYAKDFATGETAGDIISIYAKRFTNGDQGKALKELISKYNLDYLIKDTHASSRHSYFSSSDGEAASPKKASSQNDNGNNNNSYDKNSYEKMQNIIKSIKPYQKGDPVDLYLKSRNIKKYSNDTYIINIERVGAVLVNLCYKSIPSKTESGKYDLTNNIVGLQEIFLNKDGTKRVKDVNNKIPTKIQRGDIKGNPVRLKAKGDNDGIIYITEGIENGLSIQEIKNNEVWCCLSISNFATLPYEDDKVYIFIFDNDFNKKVKLSNSINNIEKLQKLNIKYEIDNNIIVVNEGDYNVKTTIEKLELLDNKNFLYYIPRGEGKDANDLLKENKLQDMFDEMPLEIENKKVVRQNIRKGTKELYRPLKPFNIRKNNNLTFEFVKEKLLYDNMGIVTRFFKRYGNIYKNVKGIGICKYENGIYKTAKENDLFEDIQHTLLLTYYEWNYLTDKTIIKSFKRLWEDKGVGEYKTINNIEQYILRLNTLDIDVEEFDNEKDNVINLQNGYYNLDTGEILPHKESKYFFKKIETNLIDKSKADEPNDWYKFLLSAFCEKIDGAYTNDKKGIEKIKFLQKAIGYTFSTSIREEKVFIIKGVTRTGKNTFLDTIQEVMKDYCGDMQDEEFITSQEQNNNYLLSVRASLKGKRFLHISEIGKNKRLNGAQIKRLVGNQRITAKYMHQNSFSYQQQCKYWIATNNIDFNEFDDSIKTKLFIIDFDKRFYEQGTEEAEKTGRVIDKDLKHKLLTDYNKEKILRWIIDGYELYKKEGLSPTKEMLESLEQLSVDNDSLGMFVKDNLIEYDNSKYYVENEKELKEVYDRYRQYEIYNYATNENNIIGFRKFMKLMRNRGYVINKRWDGDKRRNIYVMQNMCFTFDNLKTY